MKLQTVECLECGTVRNRVLSAQRFSVTEELHVEMERTHSCPYCEHTGTRPLEESLS